MKAYFLSDLHLGAPYFSDSHEAEKRVVAFLDSIAGDADEIYLLGDILDYWYEYRYVVPRGYVRFFGKLAELSDRGVRITWIIGNHDIWIFDYIPSELGVRVIDGVLETDIAGTHFVMAHGDGIGPLPLYFRVMRSLFRNRFCQFLFSGIHPRWTVPFANSWSRHSRATGADHASTGYHPMLDNYLRFARKHRDSHPGTSYYVFGHLHMLKDMSIDEGTVGLPPVAGADGVPTSPCNGARLIVLGEWIKTFSYAVFDGKEMTLHRYKADS